ncbi:TetR family transcriptional regulator [Nocardia lijiangensis]|uniref:TetR/AcrR family transcriptional regulator n=1 Tax=Nocardia lijiangensis TaxID=299618 RepID=UPI000A03270A|nr:TetR family transcriptional regulator [Nocardia lijiangensis]
MSPDDRAASKRTAAGRQEAVPRRRRRSAAVDDAERQGRSGRRPGKSGAREAILAAARARFAEAGFDKTSIRAVAADACVDPALVHHYFGTKQQLFAAVVEFPVDPEATLSIMEAAPLDQLGATILAAVVGVWDSPAGPGVVAVVRSILTGGEPALARTFVLEVVLERVRQRIATPEDDGRARVALVASQMMGVLVARKIIGVEPLASMPIPELVAAVGPTLQRYLTGDIGTAASESAAIAATMPTTR